MSIPSKYDSARLSKIHYIVDKYKGDNKKATKKINNKLKKTDYELGGLYTGIAHFKHKTDAHDIISMKGTNPIHVPDLVSDIKLALGKSGTDKQFKQRINTVKDIYRKNPERTYHITGHSLGGSTAIHALATSKSIRDNTASAHLFNTGYTKGFHKEQRDKLDAPARKELNKKVTHYITNGDIISNSVKSGSVGKVVEATTDSADKHGIDNFIEN